MNVKPSSVKEEGAHALKINRNDCNYGGNDRY